MVSDTSVASQPEDQLRSQSAYLAALHETTLALMNRLEPADLLENIVARAGSLVGTPHGFIYLLDTEQQELVVRVGVGIFEAIVGYRLKPGEGLAGKVWQTGKPLAVEDYHSWSGRAQVFENSPRRVRAVAAVPLKSGPEVVGVIALAYTEEGRTFDAVEVEALSRFAELASIALDNARLYATVQQELAERRLAEERLQSSRDQLSAILGGIADGISVQDNTGRIVYANDAAARVTGYPSAAQLQKAPLAEILGKFDIVDERGDPFPLDQLPGRVALQGVQSPERTLGFRIKATGEERWSVVRAMPVCDERGRVKLAVNIFHDITERKRSEDAQRFLAEASEVLSSSLDYETTLASVARLAVPRVADWCAVDIVNEDGQLRRLAVAHVDPRKVELARELQERYPVDLDAPRGVANVLRTGQSEYYPEVNDALIQAAAQDDEHLTVLREVGMRSALMVPLLARGRVLGAITLVSAESGHLLSAADLALAEDLARRAAVAIDNAWLYTERKRADEQKNELLVQVRQALDLRNQFLSIASHELKTPITLLKGYAHVLHRQAQRKGDEALLKPLRVINRQVERMTNLVDNLLDVSRIESGRIEFETAPFDLVAAVEDAVGDMRVSTPDLLLRLDRGTEDVWVRGDRPRIEQAIMNLLVNAVKYSDKRREVDVSIGRQGNYAVVSVADHGIGIPQEQQGQVFDLYFRAANAPANNYGGLGLGLYISKVIIERHGGTIGVLSEEGKGSTFHFTLPVLGEDSR